MTMGSWIDRLLDFVIPRFCPICGKRLAPNEAQLCSSCLMELPYTGFLERPYDNLVADRLYGKIRNFERGASLFYYMYDDRRQLLFDLKYHNHPEMGFWLGQEAGRMMMRTGFLDGIDALVPVPLAPVRQRQRGYNQSEVLAQGISEVSGLPVLTHVARRTTFSKSQTRLTTEQRFENVKDAFELIDAAPIRHRHVLIIDDVVTTGATTSALADKLSQAGDVRISVFSIAIAKQHH
jgi:ComF family protein